MEMSIPKDCKALATTFAVQSAVADKALAVATANQAGLSAVSAHLANIVRACNLGQMAATWFAKMAGLESHRSDMMTAEKRFKFVKGILSGAEAFEPAISGHVRAAQDVVKFYPDIIAALEALDADVARGTEEGWLSGQQTDPETAGKQRAVYESSNWFWALHARLADLQYTVEDKRIDASELESITIKVAASALETANDIPPAPTVDDASSQVQQVAVQYIQARDTVADTIKGLVAVLGGTPIETRAAASEESAEGLN